MIGTVCVTGRTPAAPGRISGELQAHPGSGPPQLSSPSPTRPQTALWLLTERPEAWCLRRAILPESRLESIRNWYPRGRFQSKLRRAKGCGLPPVGLSIRNNATPARRSSHVSLFLYRRLEESTLESSSSHEPQGTTDYRRSVARGWPTKLGGLDGKEPDPRPMTRIPARNGRTPHDSGRKESAHDRNRKVRWSFRPNKRARSRNLTVKFSGNSQGGSTGAHPWCGILRAACRRFPMSGEPRFERALPGKGLHIPRGVRLAGRMPLPRSRAARTRVLSFAAALTPSAGMGEVRSC